jgi:hypothetical protein
MERRENFFDLLRTRLLCRSPRRCKNAQRVRVLFAMATARRTSLKPLFFRHFLRAAANGALFVVSNGRRRARDG